VILTGRRNSIFNQAGQLLKRELFLLFFGFVPSLFFIQVSFGFVPFVLDKDGHSEENRLE
jgi:uncharacterized membrane protein